MAKKNEHFLRELSFVIYVRKKWSSKHENVKSREEMILKYVMKKKKLKSFGQMMYSCVQSKTHICFLKPWYCNFHDKLGYWVITSFQH